MLDPEKLKQVQKRVLVLARVNADPYDPDEWWVDHPAKGYRSLLYRFRVAGTAVLPADPSLTVLPADPTRRAAVLYEKLCPSFREEIQRTYLSDGQTVVAFTISATPTREELPQSSRRSGTLYPGTPLLDEASTGFDLLTQLGKDIDALIRFEAEDGYRTLVQLYCRYNDQFGIHGGMAQLPRQLTDEADLDAGHAAAVLDALFAPGAVYRLPADVSRLLVEIARLSNLRGEFSRGFLPKTIQDFRRICTSAGASSLKPIDPELQAIANRQAPTTDHILPNLGAFLARFQDVRLALNRAAQTIQSNLLLGSVVDWLLAHNQSQLDDIQKFNEQTEAAFRSGVSASRSQAVSAALRQTAKNRFLTQLDSALPGDENAAARRRIARMYELAEPYLCSLPVFRVREVEELARAEGALLLDEVLAVNDPQAMESIRISGEAAGRSLRNLLQREGRLEMQLPGLALPEAQIVSGHGQQLFADLQGDRVILRGHFSDDNVRELFEEAAHRGPEVATGVYQAFYYAENTLPDEKQSELDEVLSPLIGTLQQADATLLEQNHELREGFDSGGRAVSGAALVLGEADPRRVEGDIWARTSAEAARIALSTTGTRNTRQLEKPYNALLGNAPKPEPVEPDPLELDLLRLAQDALDLIRADPREPARVDELRQCLTRYREALESRDAHDDQVQRFRRLLGEVEKSLTDASADVEKRLEHGRDDLLALRESQAPPPALPIQSDPVALRHYFDGRSRIVAHYLKQVDDPTSSFAGRTRYVWMAQLVLHMHRRLPMAEGRADLGNLCGLMLELLKHWHPQKKADQVWDDFFQANPGGLPRFLPVQTLDHVRSLARAYHDFTDESRRTLRDLRADLKGLEELILSLPEGSEVVVLNMTADDFAALNWDFCPELFDAFSLQQGPGRSLIPTALLLTRSAQRWKPSSASTDLNAFLLKLDAKVHGQSHAGRCVVPPVLVAADMPEPPSGVSQAQVQPYRRDAVQRVQNLAAQLDALQPGLCFPLFAVGVPARLQMTGIEWAPYLLLARLCGHSDVRALTAEGWLALPPQALALVFADIGQPSIQQLVDRWLGDTDAVGVHRALGAGLFGWLVSLMFRGEIGSNHPLAIPAPPPAPIGTPPIPVINFWNLFLTDPALLGGMQLGWLTQFSNSVVGRLTVPAMPMQRFGGWKFQSPAPPPVNNWVAVVNNPAVRRGDSIVTVLPWLSRLLSKLY